MGIKASDDVLSFIKGEEKFMPEEYEDALGNKTIGYGDTLGERSNALTEEEATTRLRDSIKTAETELSNAIPNHTLTQAQQNVLVDMHINMGIGTMKPIIDRVNKKDYAGVAEAIKLYTKGEMKKKGHKDFGKLVELPGLVSRANKRVAMWNSQGAEEPTEALPMQAPAQDADLNAIAADMPAAKDDSDLLAIAEEMKAHDEGPDADLYSIADQMKEDDLQAEHDPEGERLAALNTASQIADPAEALKISEARRISQETGRPVDIVRAMLDEKTPEAILAEHGHATIAKHFPAMAEIVGKDPQNYIFVREKADYAKKVELAARNLKPDDRNDYEKALSDNIDNIAVAVLFQQGINGKMSFEQMGNQLEHFDAKKRNTEFSYSTRMGMEEIAKKKQEMAAPLAKMIEGVTEGNALELDDYEKILPAIKKTYDGSIESAEAVLSWMKALVTNPKATSVSLLSSSGSSGAPLAFSLAGGAVGNIPGAIVGGLGALATSGVLSFSEYMQGELEQFRDKGTGKIDYKTAFSDADRVSKWRKSALLYAGVMGGSDVLFGYAGSKMLAKSVAKETTKRTVGQKAAKAAVGFLKTNALEGAGEAGSQLTATSATDFYNDRLDSKKMGANLADAVEEGVMSLPMSGTMNTMGMGAHLIYDELRSGAGKTVKMAEEATNANKATADSSETRAARDSDPEVKTNPGPVDDLIDSATKGEGVRVSPSEWKRFHELNGTDPVTSLHVFSPAIQEAFAKHQESDTSVFIPASEWYKNTEEFADIDAVIRFKDNNYNSVEANEVAEEIQVNPMRIIKDLFNPHKKTFKGELNVRHGRTEVRHRYNSETQEWEQYKVDKPLTKFEKGYTGIEGEGDDATSTRYDGDGGTFGGDGVYLDNNGVWTNDGGDGMGRWSVDAVYDVKAQFKNALVITPKTIKSVVKKFGFISEGNNTDPHKEFAAKVKAAGHDAIIIEGFNKHQHDWEAKAKKLGRTRPDEYAREGQPKEQHYFMPGDNPAIEKRAEKKLRKQLESYKNRTPEEIDAYIEEEKKRGYLAYQAAEMAVEDMGGDTYLTQDQIFAFHPENLEVKGLSKDKMTPQYINQHQPKDNGDAEFDEEIEADDDSQLDEQDPANEPIEIIEPTGPDGNIISYPVHLLQTHLNAGEKKVFQSILSRIKKANPKFSPEMAEHFATIQLRHMRARARMMGHDLVTEAKRLSIGRATRKEAAEAHGIFKWQKIFGAPFTIVFAKSADAATVVHEFGHSWLHEMVEDYAHIMSIPEDKLTLEQAEYKQAMITVSEKLKLTSRGLNIGDLWKLDKADSKRVHETFAQTVEMYFLHGKFADSKIKGLMETFRKWFTAAILTVGKAYAEYPALKITPQVERMMESILGISTKLDEEVMPMFDDPLFDPKMLGAMGPKYMETVKDARSYVIGEFVSDVVLRGFADREKLIDEAHNRVHEAAAKEVDARPEMGLLRNFIQAYKDYKAGIFSGDPRFSFNSVMKVLAASDEKLAADLRKKTHPALIAPKGKGGADVAMFMHLNGLNAKEMLAIMHTMSTRDEQIKEIFDQRIRTEIPVLKTDAEIHQAAEDALNSKGKEWLLLEELKILASHDFATLRNLIEKVANPVEALARASKQKLMDIAVMLTATAKVDTFKVKTYLLDSIRHRRDAARKFKVGNIQGAFDAKYREAISYFAYKSAVAFQKQLDKADALIKRVQDFSRLRDLSKVYDANVMGYAKELVSAVINGNMIPVFDPSNFSEYSGLSDPQIDIINKAIATFMNTVGHTDKSPGATGINITVEGKAAFGELVGVLIKQARLARDEEMKNNRAGTAADATQAREDIMKVNNVIDFIQDRRPFAPGSMHSSLRTTRAVLSSFYPDDLAFTNSVLGKLFHAVVNAEAIRNLEYNKFRDMLSKSIRATLGKDPMMTRIFGPILSRGSKALHTLRLTSSELYTSPSAKPILAPELGPKDANDVPVGFSFANTAELIFAFLMMGSESGARHFLIGHLGMVANPTGDGISDLRAQWDKFMQRMIDEKVFTENHFKFCQVVWGIFEAIHPLVKVAMRRSDGFEMGHIDGWEISTPWGKAMGGYMPVAGVDAMAQQDTAGLRDPDTMNYKAQDMYPAMRTGMTKTRSDEFKKISLDLGRVPSYLGAALNIAYLRNPLLDFGRVIDHPLVRSAMDEKRPGAIGDPEHGVIVPWFTDVKSQTFTRYSADMVDGINRIIRKNANTIMYMGNVILTPVKQTFGLAPVIAKIGISSTLNGIWKHATSPLSAQKFISENSPVMARRLKTSVEQAVQTWDELETNFDWMSQTEEMKDRLTFLPIQFMQNRVDIAAWFGAYHKVVDQVGHEKAVNFANDTVTVTQGSSDVSNLANFQRGTDTRKLFTMTTSNRIAQYNLLFTEVMRDAKTTQARKKAYLMFLVSLVFVLPSFMDAKIGQIMNPEEEDEKKDESEKAMDELYVLAKRTAIGTGEYLFPALPASPGIQIYEGAKASVKGVPDLINGVDLTAYQKASMLRALTLIFGSGSAAAIARAYLFEESILDPEDLKDRRRERSLQLREIKQEQQ